MLIFKIPYFIFEFWRIIKQNLPADEVEFSANYHQHFSIDLRYLGAFFAYGIKSQYE